MIGPKTKSGKVLEIRWGRSPCSNGAVTIPSKPSNRLGYKPYQDKLTCSTISKSFTPQSITTNKVGYKKLKNNFEVVFRIIVNVTAFPKSMFVPKYKNDKKTGFVSVNTNHYICLSTMKKAVSIFLLVIFLFNAVGYYVFFKVVQHQIKSEIKKEIKLNLNSSELTVIKFPLSEIRNIHWLEKGKEFSYDNQMFDVVRRTSNDGIITFYCINDKQEKKLFENLEEQILKQIEQNKNSKKNSSKKGSDQQIKIYFFEAISFCIIPKFSAIEFNPYNEQYTSVLISIKTPPPQI